MLFFQLEGKNLCAHPPPLTSGAARAVYLSKGCRGPLTVESVDEFVACGQLGGDLEPLSSLARSTLGSSGQHQDAPFPLPPSVSATALRPGTTPTDGAGKIDNAELLLLESRVHHWLDRLTATTANQTGVPTPIKGPHASSSPAALELTTLWERRCTAVDQTVSQMHHDAVQVAIAALRRQGSAAVSRYEALQQTLAGALNDVNALPAVLRLLRPALERLAGADDLTEAADAATLAMRAVFLAAKRCAYLAMGANLAALLQAMGQDVVAVVQRCIGGEGHPSMLFKYCYVDGEVRNAPLIGTPALLVVQGGPYYRATPSPQQTNCAVRFARWAISRPALLSKPPWLRKRGCCEGKVCSAAAQPWHL